MQEDRDFKNWLRLNNEVAPLIVKRIRRELRNAGGKGRFILNIQEKRKGHDHDEIVIVLGPIAAQIIEPIKNELQEIGKGKDCGVMLGKQEHLLD